MGLDAELEATADWVARQVANSIPLEEIAVFAPTTDPFVDLIADRLERLPWHEAIFPVHVANGLPLTHFAVRSAHSCCACARCAAISPPIF